MKIFNHYIYRLSVMLLAIEALTLIAAFYFGVAVRFHDQANDFLPNHLNKLLPQACIFAAVMIFSMKAMGMYQLTYREDFHHTLLRLMPSFALGFGMMTLTLYLAPDIYFGRGILGIVLLFGATGILLVRFIFSKGAKLAFLKPQIMVLGSSALASECAEIAAHNASQHQFSLLGFVALPDEQSVIPPSALLPANKSLLTLATELSADEIVVAGNQNSQKFPVQELLECKLNGIKVIDSSTFFEREMSQIRVNSLNPNWLVFGGGFDQSGLRIGIKRVFDLFASLLLLVFTLPLMLLTALAIHLYDRGPVFYRQERIGLEGHPFTVLKFRSMRTDAEKSGKPQWATENDPRITPVGRLIRTLRIDELPQIINVLRGEMSLVGPRPERDYFVKQLCEKIPYFNVRHSVKPGITGWAQVSYQYGSSVEDALQKLQYDLYYVKNNSLFLDIVILIDTIQVVLSGRGSR